jgi:opacity protein-like surface antigen
MTRIQRLAILVATAFAAAASVAPAQAQAQAQALDGFYGGIAFRDRGTESAGSSWGPRTLGLQPAAGEDGTSRQRVFGGYRWRNDLALAAGFERIESYALRPFGAGTPGGVGLTLAAPQDAGTRAAWNVDVVGSYTFLRSLALYGRVGYAQSDLAPATLTNLFTSDVRRPRDGVNVGLGMRYDVTRALGVNLEYTRFGRFATETFATPVPDSDQVRLGVQFRF